ncbi:hypothetical protein ACHAWX_005180 [Stephanocyclus meneghinianus]
MNYTTLFALLLSTSPSILPLSTTAAFLTHPKTPFFAGLRHSFSPPHLRSHMPPTAAAAAENHRPPTKQIAVIGAGAAGLAAARAFLRRSDRDRVRFEVTVLERRPSVGGIWDRDEPSSSSSSKRRPMYENLRTNLPKELMAFREFPWGGDGAEESYVTHRKVRRYLESYADEFRLKDCIRFGCTVERLTVLLNPQNSSDDDNGNNDNNEWPRISLQWKVHDDNAQRQQTFDAVCICNGHYALPSIPPLPGLSSFPGPVRHAIEYDRPDEYAHKTVLCIGARASGTDIAREIGSVANAVYLSDSTCRQRQHFGNVVLLPRTTRIDDGGAVHFSASTNDEEEVIQGIDVIIFCSGYDYDFPFINENLNLDLQFAPGERRVRPLYEQLWHAKYPSVSFIGLPHSVVPFPLFEIQANAVRTAYELQFAGQSGILPSLSERLEAAECDASSGGPEEPGRVQDTHYLGPHQWDYCRRLAKLGRFYDASLENYIATNKELYDCSGRERKAMVPGGKDTYRQTRFARDDDSRSYRILYSEMSSAQSV